MSMNPIMGTPVFNVNRFSGNELDDNTGMSIGNRVRQARKDAKMTQGELASKAGIKQSTISDLELGKSQGSTSVASIATALGVSPLWLETGRGPMRTGSEDGSALHGLKPGTYMRVEAVEDDDPRMTLIPRVRLRLTAGIIGFEVEPEPGEDVSWMIPTAWLQARGFKREQLISIGIHGDSMEPSFYDGDSVILNTADREPADGGVFAVNYEGEPVIKRLTRDAGQWWLTSDNSDQRKYQRKVCRGDGCIIIGRVVKRETERF
jgi:phage repressor protein C with HTH and peptisase S24 domain